MGAKHVIHGGEILRKERGGIQPLPRNGLGGAVPVHIIGQIGIDDQGLIPEFQQASLLPQLENRGLLPGQIHGTDIVICHGKPSFLYGMS